MRVAGNIVLVLAAAAGPVAAQDVKTGVDAWARGDYRAAADQWRAPAVAGDADAQFNLGQAYKLGRGVPLDPALAESWFRKAALQGHFQAEDNYGLALYTAGKKSDAVPWLEKSVARGEPRTQLVLGTMLFNGDGVARDYPRAYALMTLASQKGLKSASETLAQMDQYISPADREKGIGLADRYGQQLRALPPLPTPTSARGPMLAATPEARRPVRAAPPPAPMAVARPAPKPVPKPVAARPQPVRTAGGWRIQLGAFRDHANAETLWNRVRGRLGTAQPVYVKSGAVTRLQAGGYPSRSEAQHACAAAGAPCVVVAP
jgi:hypothetical protein